MSDSLSHVSVGIGAALGELSLVVDILLGGLGNESHGLYGLHREGSCGGLAGEHDSAGAVVDSVCHVGDLSTGRSRVGDHGLQHLCGSYHLLAGIVALVDELLLDRRDLLEWDLNAHVASCDHYTVGGLKDLVDVLNAVGILDLSDYANVEPAQALGEFSQVVYISRRSYEAGSDEVKAHF